MLGFVVQETASVFIRLVGFELTLNDFWFINVFRETRGFYECVMRSLICQHSIDVRTRLPPASRSRCRRAQSERESPTEPAQCEAQTLLTLQR